MPTHADYKALVCVFLPGAMDAYNSVVATDSASWSVYSAARGDAATGIALAPLGAATQGTGSINQQIGGPLAITPLTAQAGRTFALHPALSGVRDLFVAKKLGIIANVGNLLGPTTKADYLNNTPKKPNKLGSHNDQQSVAQAGGTEGATRGWGGRMMDTLLAGNTTPGVSAMSIRGNTPWTVGAQTRSYQMDAAGPIVIGDTNGQLVGSTAVRDALLALMRTARRDKVIDREYAAVCDRSFNLASALNTALPPANTAAWANPPAGPLGEQLRAVARCIDASQALGMKKQIFFVGMGGWDHHSGLNDGLNTLLGQLSATLVWWQGVLDGMTGGVAAKVTTFTMTEFGRALVTNGDGCDHGWGGHAFVMGGAVKGGDIYGRFPTYNLNGSDMVANGQLLPAIGNDQYWATLGAWLGLTDAQLLAALPGLAQWPAGERNLGFMN